MKIARNITMIFFFLSLLWLTTPLLAENEAMQIQKATALIKALLIDSDSAKFQALRMVLNSQVEQSVCGKVNARNRFGGYTGFSEFNVSGERANIVDIERAETIRFYKLSGCAGPEAEFEMRLEDEANFNCSVIWNLLVNIIVQGEDKEKALDAAIVATKNRAKENGGDISQEQLQLIRSQYNQTLEQTLANKQQVQAIKKNSEYEGKIFIATCGANTANVLKERVRIK